MSSPIPRSGKVHSVPAPAPQKYPLKLILVSSRLQNSRNARQENILVRDETNWQRMWNNEGAPRKRVWERIHLKSRCACFLYASCWPRFLHLWVSVYENHVNSLQLKDYSAHVHPLGLIAQRLDPRALEFTCLLTSSQQATYLLCASSLKWG